MTASPSTTPAARPATYDDLRALPSDVRAEIIDGEVVVSPSPTARHNQVSKALARDLDAAALDHGYESVQDVDVQWVPSGQVTRPDVFVVTTDVASSTDLPVREVPVVVVELLSPDSAARDFVKKPRLAAAAGVAEYWVVDPASGEVYRHTLADGRYDVEVVAPGDEVSIDTLPFPYTLRPDVLGRCRP